MLIFIAAVATAIAVILLFVYIIRINRTRAKYLNDDSMQKLAQKAADKAVKNDPFVTCDFCGARIDTRTQVTCPQCGGAYGKDTEWSDRHVPDVEKASKHARKQYSTLHAKVKEQNRPTVKKIRILLALLIAGILVSIGLFVYSGIQKEQEKLKDQQVEKYYEPTDYGFGNVSILDDDIIEVCVGNVYARKNYKGLYDYSVELNIINHSKDVLEIGVLVNEKNGHKTIALMQSRVPADNSWHRKILKVSDVEEPYLKTMRVESVIAKLLSYTPVAGTGTNQMIVSTADYETEDVNEFSDTDTVGLIMKAHEQITREDSPIENVVLDMSMNHGGQADAAVFTLAWLLGEASISIENTMTGAMSSATYRADVNRDRKFDEKDTVTDKNIYCLISPLSFSCGNLVPCVLKDSNRATLLGRTSGGGSCIVQFISSAWGTSFRISGPQRLSFLKNGSFYDIDRGADPDYQISTPEKYYDRQALTDYINSLY